MRETAGRLRSRAYDAIDKRRALPPPVDAADMPSHAESLVAWSRLTTRHGDLAFVMEPHGVLIGYAIVGDTVAAFVEIREGASGEPGTHWLLAADGDGVNAAATYAPGPLVPGKPEASGREILRHLAESAGTSRPDWPSTMTAASQILQHYGQDALTLAERTIAAARVRDPIGEIDERHIFHAAIAIAARVLSKIGRTRLLTSRSTPDQAAAARAMSATAAQVRDVEAFLSARPWLHTLTATSPRAVHGVGIDEGEARLAKIHGLAPAHMRRLGPEVGDVTGPVVEMMASIPIDWVPERGDETEWTAFRAMSELLGIPTARHALRTLVDDAKGRWKAFATRIATECDQDPEAFLEGWRTEALAEITARSRFEDLDQFRECPPRVPGYRIRDALDLPRMMEVDLGRMRRIDDDETQLRARRLAEDALIGTRGLSSLLAASARWHVDLALNSTTLRRPEMTWDPILPRWTDPSTGIEVIPLSSSYQMAFEGTVGTNPDGTAGLAHCVGGDGYVMDAAEGRIAIVSLRRGGERLSTAEIRLGVGRESLDRDDQEPWWVVQHRGHRNGPPEADAAATLATYVALPDVKLAISSASLRKVSFPPMCDPETPEEILARWRPLMTGRWRNASIDDVEAWFANRRGRT